MASSDSRDVPVISVSRNEASAEFFDGTARGELLVRRCPQCSLVIAPNVPQCPDCASIDLTWEPAGGTATLVTWTVVPGPDDTAVVAGIVELTEGPWLHARILGVAPEDLAEGLALSVGFQRYGDGEAVPVFHAA
ncbi:OB-fold domain-containing protein [Saccharopolyspora sp. K220]|uniref:Zn-ribbon domain-containing OB-fold protein n=1 Tax=Saccharopolyspora soli TaxID=2926618 RepID=UPI001F589CDA|nr:OB-fold domain-containing protein [Saccharopolyspora soli]MCI2424214.1 OB-fold domain-containing protein [Saccharopolyspora soli]